MRPQYAASSLTSDLPNGSGLFPLIKTCLHWPSKIPRGPLVSGQPRYLRPPDSFLVLFKRPDPPIPLSPSGPQQYLGNSMTPEFPRSSFPLSLTRRFPAPFGLPQPIHLENPWPASGPCCVSSKKNDFPMTSLCRPRTCYSPRRT